MKNVQNANASNIVVLWLPYNHVKKNVAEPSPESKNDAKIAKKIKGTVPYAALLKLVQFLGNNFYFRDFSVSCRNSWIS
jgi:hypothetical protein